MSSELLAQWKRDEAAVFEGWDFSYIRERWLEEQPDWDYRAEAKWLINNSASVLDMATGGGELFSSLAPFPTRTIAIEGYQPNVGVARKRLEPLGVQVLAANTDLPFKESTFDLVLNRHGAHNVAEIHRVLNDRGRVLTQQVGGGNLIEVMDAFGVRPRWTDNVLSVVREKMQRLGFRIERARDWRGKVRVLDVGAVVYFLKAVPWIVPGFRVDSHLKHLWKLQETLEREGRLEFTCSRFLIAARK
jgi:SAM-dependent methyltransferase